MEKKQYHSILIVKPGAIGDVLQLTPVIRELARHYPHAEIRVLVGSPSTSELFKYNRNVREVIVFDKAGEHRSMKALLGLWRTLRKKDFDLIVHFQRSNLRTWLLVSAAFPCRILVYHKARERRVHAVMNHLETVAPLGIDPTRTSLDLELNTGPADKDFAEKLLAPSTAKLGQRLVALNPGASHIVNRWGAENYAALAGRLARELSAAIIIIGGNDDIARGQQIGESSGAHPRIIAGKTTLLQLAAVLERCDLLVTGDTGPMHIATAVGTPVLALFGAADSARTGPVGKGHIVLQSRDVACVPCRSRICDHKPYLACMQNLSVETVFNTIREMLKNKN